MSVETPSKTYIEIIKSTELIGKVVRNLGLDKETEAERGGISKLMPSYVKAAGEDLKQLLMDLTPLQLLDDPIAATARKMRDVFKEAAI